MTSPMRVLILNTCSTLNRGDAAIVLAQARLLRACLPGAQIALTSRSPGIDAPVYVRLGLEVLPPLTPALSVYRGAKRKLLGSLRQALDVRGKQRLLGVLARSDLVLSCGGGYFFSYRRGLPGTMFWQNALQVRLAARARKPLIFLPQSFGPLASAAARAALRDVLASSAVVRIFAREQASLDLLAHLLPDAHPGRVALCPDMAFYLRRDANGRVPAASAVEAGPPVLAVNVRPWAFPGVGTPAERRARREAYLAALAAAAAFFVAQYGGRVVVFPQSLGPDPAEDDRPICRELVERVRALVRGPASVQYMEPDPAELDEHRRLLARATLLIGTRLHACILAMVAGTPAISIGYQAKSQGTLALLGLPHLNVDINSVAADELVSGIERVWSDRAALAAQIELGVERAAAWIEDQVGTVLRSVGS